MLSHHRFLTLLALLLIPLVVGGFILLRQSKSCIHADKKFCSFLSDLAIKDFEGTQGSFISQIGDKASKVQWVLGKNSKQIQVVTDGRESMHMIVIENTVYVKDYRDGLWWKQSKKDMDRYVYELSFDPEVFIKQVVDRLNNPNLKLAKQVEVACGKQTCIQYSFSIDNFKHREFVSIDHQDNHLLQYAGKKDDTSTAFTVIFKKKEIYAPTDTKQAEKSQNILLDQMNSSSTQQSAKDLEYVKEFEKQMKGN